MTSKQLLTAFGYINGAYIDDARAALGLAAAGEGNGKRRANVRRALRTALIAAAVAALLAATAYAAGWFGLAGLKLGAAGTAGLSRISLQGLADTPEAKGAAEWLEYYAGQTGKMREIDEPFAAACAEKYGTYGIAAQADLDKLNELCEKYSLTYLGTSTTPENEHAFCEAADVGRLTSSEGGYVNEYKSAYVYSSGTFHAEGGIYSATHAYDIPYQLTRSVKGVLDYVTISVADVNAFTEWDYDTADGARLHLANTAPDAPRKQSFIFYETDDAFISVSFLHESAADYLGDGVIDGVGDEFVTFDIPDAELETLAECFDWAAFTDPARGMDTDFAPSREYASVDTDALIAVKDKAADFSAAEGGDNALYYLKLNYAQEIEPHIAGFRLVDYYLIPGSNTVIGWVQFAGVAKQPLDWAYEEIDGERVYCRGVELTGGETGGEWSVGAGFDMRPVALQENLDPGERMLRRDGAPLADLTGASLYVRATGEWYTLSDPAALELLGQTLRFSHIPGGKAQCGVWDPIILDHADGTSTLAYTLDSGENLLYIYGTRQSCMMGVSIFELFGVPLAPKGYSERDGIVTTRIENPTGAVNAVVEYDYIKNGNPIARRVTDELGETREARYEYDPDGNMLRETWHDPDGSTTRDITYTYGENGLLAEISDVADSMWEKHVYYYDAQNRPTRIESFNSARPTTPYISRYTYAETGTATFTQSYE